MALLEVVSGLSSFATLHSWIIEQIDNIGDTKKSKKIDDIGIEFKTQYLSRLNDEFIEEKVDQFIAGSASDFSTKSIFEFFTSAERQKVINDFFLRNPKLQFTDKEKIIDILNSYLDKLCEYLSQKLSYDSKIIIKTIKDSERITKENLKEINDKLFNPNIYSIGDFSNKIVSKINALNVLILNYLHINVWLKDANDAFLAGGSLTDVILRIKSLFELINKKELNRVSGVNCENSFEALFNMINVLAPDLSTELNTFYCRNVVQTIACINGFLEKNEAYYISIGALGLFNDNSEENIFKCIMNNLLLFLTISFNVLDNLWKDKDYEKIEVEVSNEMHQYLLSHINHMIDENSIKFIKVIYDKKSIVDVELARIFFCEIDELRKKLYKYTKEFLSYSYYDNHSTKLYIRKMYLKTFELYYSDIFGEKQYES